MARKQPTKRIPRANGKRLVTELLTEHGTMERDDVVEKLMDALPNEYTRHRALNLLWIMSKRGELVQAMTPEGMTLYLPQRRDTDTAVTLNIQYGGRTHAIKVADALVLYKQLALVFKHDQ